MAGKHSGGRRVDFTSLIHSVAGGKFAGNTMVWESRWFATSQARNGTEIRINRAIQLYDTGPTESTGSLAFASHDWRASS